MRCDYRRHQGRSNYPGKTRIISISKAFSISLDRPGSTVRGAGATGNDHLWGHDCSSTTDSRAFHMARLSAPISAPDEASPHACRAGSNARQPADGGPPIPSRAADGGLPRVPGPSEGPRTAVVSPGTRASPVAPADSLAGTTARSMAPHPQKSGPDPNGGKSRSARPRASPRAFASASCRRRVKTDPQTTAEI